MSFIHSEKNTISEPKVECKQGLTTTFVLRKQRMRVVGRNHVANDSSQGLTLVNKVTNL
jgi:hypothetical protein